MYRAVDRGNDREDLNSKGGKTMKDKSSPMTASMALIAVACCLIVVGSSDSGVEKYLFDGASVLLCLLALIILLRLQLKN